jgi:autotransporter-associated beta strand protein
MGPSKPICRSCVRAWPLLAACAVASPTYAQFNPPAGTTADQTADLGGAASVTKDGAGTTRVTVNQTYSGATTVNAGTLIFYGNTASSSFQVNGGTLMLGGNVAAAPITLNGGTLRFGAQRTIARDGLGNARNWIATPSGDTNGFNFGAGATFYTQGRAAGQPQAILDAGLPNNGLVTSLANPATAFQLTPEGLDGGRVDSNEGTAVRFIDFAAADERRYAEVQVLVGTSTLVSPATSMSFLSYARYSDATTSNVFSGNVSGIPLYTANTGTPAVTAGLFNRDNSTYLGTTGSLYAQALAVDPTKTLVQFGVNRSGSTGHQGGIFAVSGLAVNEATFTSPITVTAASTLDLAGAAASASGVNLVGPSLGIDAATLTVVRNVPSNLAFRGTFDTLDFTNGGGLVIANSPGGGVGSVAAGTINVAANTTSTVTGQLSSPVGGTTFAGPGKLVLTSSNTALDGEVRVNGGTLELNPGGNGGNPGVGLLDAASNVIVTGGTLNLLGNNAISGNGGGERPITIAAGGVVNANNGNHGIAALTLAGGELASGPAPATQFGSFNLTANVAVTDDSTLSATLANLTATRTFTVNPGKALSVTGSFMGSGGLTKAGAGTMTLTQPSNFVGNVSVDLGVLRLEHGEALGTAAKTLSFGGDNRGIELAGGITVPATVTWITSNGGTGAAVPDAIRSVSGTNTIAGQIRMQGGGGNTLVRVDAGSTLHLDGGATILTGLGFDRTLVLAGEGAGSVNGVIANRADNGRITSLEHRGPGTWTLDAANTYSGATTLTGGTLRIGPGGSIPNSVAIDVRSAATLDVTDLAPAGFTVGNAQTLRGDGVVTGSLVTIAAGGTIAPRGDASAVGSLRLENGLTLNGTYVAEIDFQNVLTGAHAADQLEVASGDVALAGGTIRLTLLNAPLGVLDTPATIVLVNNAGAGTTTLTNVTWDPQSNAPFVYSILDTYDAATSSDTGGNDLAIRISAVPEPGSLVALAALAVLAGRRRRR